MKYTAIVVALALSTGCASGPSYKDKQASIPKVAEDKARLLLYRTKESKLYIGRSAPVSLNGAKVGDVSYGGFTYTDVSLGTYTLRTETWDAAGACEVSFKIEDTKKIYYFEIKPRDESFQAFKDGSTILLPVIPGLIAMANESKGKTCGGLFSLSPVEPEKALSRLGK